MSDAYMNAYMTQRWKKRRKLAIKRLGGCCVKCGTKKNLQFDHIDPKTKLFTIARGYSFSKNRFWKEVYKCQLLCEKHHVVKSNKQKAKGENNGNAIFTNSEVRKYRKLHAEGKITAKQISVKLGVHRVTARDMLIYKTYKSVN